MRSWDLQICAPLQPARLPAPTRSFFCWSMLPPVTLTRDAVKSAAEILVVTVKATKHCKSVFVLNFRIENKYWNIMNWVMGGCWRHNYLICKNVLRVICNILHSVSQHSQQTCRVSYCHCKDQSAASDPQVGAFWLLKSRLKSRGGRAIRNDPLEQIKLAGTVNSLRLLPKPTFVDGLLWDVALPGCFTIL